MSDGMISPAICVVIAAASRSMPAARCTLKPAQPAVAPVSAIIAAMKSGRAAVRRSAALSSSARRSLGPSADQAGNAAAAASAARIGVLDGGRRGAARHLAGDRIAPLEGVAGGGRSLPAISRVMAFMGSPSLRMRRVERR